MNFVFGIAFAVGLVVRKPPKASNNELLTVYFSKVTRIYIYASRVPLRLTMTHCDTNPITSCPGSAGHQLHGCGPADFHIPHDESPPVPKPTQVKPKDLCCTDVLHDLLIALLNFSQPPVRVTFARYKAEGYTSRWANLLASVPRTNAAAQRDEAGMIAAEAALVTLQFPRELLTMLWPKLWGL